MDAVKAAADAAEAKGIVKCTVEEIDAWKKEYDEKTKAFILEFCRFVHSPELIKEAKLALNPILSKYGGVFRDLAVGSVTGLCDI
mmetsp:Transcript_33910/g.45825  ORF Transcript_33910/g.45825 Transcript_33910/m.45825 type:complete len:85 (+) Transcript_33910:254-508(+)